LQERQDNRIAVLIIFNVLPNPFQIDLALCCPVLIGQLPIIHLPDLLANLLVYFIQALNHEALETIELFRLFLEIVVQIAYFVSHLHIILHLLLLQQLALLLQICVDLLHFFQQHFAFTGCPHFRRQFIGFG